MQRLLIVPFIDSPANLSNYSQESLEKDLESGLLSQPFLKTIKTGYPFNIAVNK